nr:trypsin-like serine protease [Ornithinimicrobium sediminis]
MVALVENPEGALVPAWRCSGALVDSTHFLTAGHCTYGADSVEIWFSEDVAGTSYPWPGEDSITGTPHTHPDYDDAAFYLNDLGMVVLDEPFELAEYGELPEEGYFDDFFVKRGQNKQEFTAVGYGLQRSMPAQTGLTEAVVERRQATLRIINQDAAFGEKKAGNSVLFTNNASSGGTCSGDSGGPIFVEGSTTIAAVTSYGLNARCAGTGGGYRVDTADDLDWLATFGLSPTES